MSIYSFFYGNGVLDDFVEFGRVHYRDDPRWIPPLEDVFRAQLCRRDPDQIDAPARHFLVKHNDQVVGRVSARVNPRLRSDGEPVGTVANFECEDDPTVAAALFDAAREWLKARHGVRRVWGPMDGDIWHGYRLMTRGFERETFPGEPYNKPYYPDLFRGYGWRELRAWESVELAEPRDVVPLLEWGGPCLGQALSQGYRFEPFDLRQPAEELAKLHPLLTECFSEFVGFTPISLEDFQREFSFLRHALRPGWFHFIRGPEGDLVGFAGALLDLSHALRGMRGRQHVLARLRFAMRRRRADRAVFYLVGLRPGDPARGSGLGAAAVRQILGTVHREGLHSVVAALMPSGGRSKSLVGKSAPEAQRRYALYEIRS